MIDVPLDNYGNPIYPPPDNENTGVGAVSGPDGYVPGIALGYNMGMGSAGYGPVAWPPTGTAQASSPSGSGGSGGPDYGFWEDAPAFDWKNPYGDFSYDEFSAPTPDSIFADPGYQFRVDQGRQALEQSAAGRGVLRTGGTLKDLLNYGQSLASQEYGNVFDRSLRTYDTNRSNAFQNYTTNYTNAFGLAREQYAPKLVNWQTKMDFSKSAADQAFDRSWQEFMWNNPSASDILGLSVG